MRVLVITGVLPHHRHFCRELARSHELVGVLHPRTVRASRIEKLKRERRRAGLAYAGLRAAATIPALGGWRRDAAYAEAEQRFFGAEGENVPTALEQEVDVKSSAVIDLVERLSPEATVCLGGPVYPAALIEAAAPVFNFHSGVSPLYNGASTIDFAFANGHLGMCGGTLMVMNPRVDGGDILAHHLPAIDADDTPATLFMKTIGGGAVLARRFLEHVSRGGGFTKAPQPPALFYFRGRDWTLHHAQLVSRAVEEQVARAYTREAADFEYWDLAGDEDATQAMLANVRALANLA